MLAAMHIATMAVILPVAKGPMGANVLQPDESLHQVDQSSSVLSVPELFRFLRLIHSCAWGATQLTRGLALYLGWALCQ